MQVAIDPGFTRLGWAVGKNNELFDWGTLYLSGRDRLREIYDKVSNLFLEWRPSVVYVEDFRIYRSDIRDKHKTAFAIGIVVACAYEHGAEVCLLNHRSWRADFERIYWVVEKRLSEKWKEGLRSGSEHSRDAVMMLLPRVVDLKKLLGEQGYDRGAR